MAANDELDISADCLTVASAVNRMAMLRYATNCFSGTVIRNRMGVELSVVAAAVVVAAAAAAVAAADDLVAAMFDTSGKTRASSFPLNFRLSN